MYRQNARDIGGIVDIVRALHSSRLTSGPCATDMVYTPHQWRSHIPSSRPEMSAIFCQRNTFLVKVCIYVYNAPLVSFQCDYGMGKRLYERAKFSHMLLLAGMDCAAIVRVRWCDILGVFVCLASQTRARPQMEASRASGDIARRHIGFEYNSTSHECRHPLRVVTR